MCILLHNTAETLRSVVSHANIYAKHRDVVIASDYFVSTQPSAGLQPGMRHGVGIGVACRNCQCTTTGETQVLLRVHVQVLFRDFVPLARQGPRTGRRAANNLVPAASGIEDVSINNNPIVPAGPRPQV